MFTRRPIMPSQLPPNQLAIIEEAENDIVPPPAKRGRRPYTSEEVKAAKERKLAKQLAAKDNTLAAMSKKKFNFSLKQRLS